MLASVTRPLEESAYSIPGWSWWIDDDPRHTEVDVSRQDADPQVASRCSALGREHARRELRPILGRAGAADDGHVPIVDLSLSSKTRSLPEITDIVIYDLVPSLHRIEGTYRVRGDGGKYREFVRATRSGADVAAMICRPRRRCGLPRTTWSRQRAG